MPYPNWKVEALISGQSSIDSTWTEQDFADLAMAALDQAGVDKDDQDQVSLALSVYGLETPTMFAARSPNTSARRKGA